MLASSQQQYIMLKCRRRASAGATSHCSIRWLQKAVVLHSRFFKMDAFLLDSTSCDLWRNSINPVTDRILKISMTVRPTQSSHWNGLWYPWNEKELP